MIYLAGACLAVLAFLVVWQSYVFAQEREEFAAERQQWVRERRDLNNRIQIPDAAPYLAEADSGSEDDLPVLPEFEMDSDALERAKAELEAAGYEEGPAL
jgi:hypothetical protein